MHNLRSICVYCGSSPGHDPVHVAAARTLGASIAGHGLRLVYGGGTKGIMGAVAEGVRAEGGRVLGIIPEFLLPKEAPNHTGDPLTEIVVTADMHERKHRMFTESDAFVAMPGGIGTIEEIIEMMTWGQLGRHGKPMVFANINGFWNPMIDMLRQCHREGFLHGAHRIKSLVVGEANEIVPRLLSLDADGSGGDASIIDHL